MFISPAYAQAAGSAQSSGIASFLSLAPLFLVFVVFYFLMIRPQQKRMKTLQNAVAAVKKGDSVITAGGVVGKVTKVEDAFVEVEIAANVRVKVVKATIAAVKKGDSVITGGGIAGKVTKVEDLFVEVEIAPNTRIRVVKAMLAEVTPLGGKPAND